jgi:hypothetical protein
MAAPPVVMQCESTMVTVVFPGIVLRSSTCIGVDSLARGGGSMRLFWEPLWWGVLTGTACGGSSVFPASMGEGCECIYGDMCPLWHGHL